jgi:hypothetical protein
VALSENTGTLVSFPKGVVIDFGRETIGIRNGVDTNVLAYLGSGGSSVYSLGNHADAQQNADYLKIVRTWEPMWLIAINGMNVGNQAQPWDRPSRRSRFAKIFGLNDFQVNEDRFSHGLRWLRFLQFQAFSCSESASQVTSAQSNQLLVVNPRRLHMDEARQALQGTPGFGSAARNLVPPASPSFAIPNLDELLQVEHIVGISRVLAGLAAYGEVADRQNRTILSAPSNASAVALTCATVSPIEFTKNSGLADLAPSWRSPSIRSQFANPAASNSRKPVISRLWCSEGW